jgi:hypothetical protein
LGPQPAAQDHQEVSDTREEVNIVMFVTLWPLDTTLLPTSDGLRTKTCRANPSKPIFKSETKATMENIENVPVASNVLQSPAAGKVMVE